MRTEEGNKVPSTLGEYLQFCKLLSGDSDAAGFLSDKIRDARDGEDAEVVASDSQMRAILLPLLLTKNGEPI